MRAVTSAEHILTFPTDDRDPDRRLIAYRWVLLMHLASELTVAVLRQRGVVGTSPLPISLAAVAGLALGLAFFPRVRRFATPLATALLLFAVLRFFPNIANHTMLLLIGLAALSWFDGSTRAERGLAMGTLRWAGALVFFATGVQKVLHATYFRGEFLAFQVAHGERFAAFFRQLLPGTEISRLDALGLAAGPAAGPTDVFRAYVTAAPVIGAGPYRLDSAIGLTLSNSVWAFELVAPALLLWRRTRGPTVVAIVLFLVGLELGAREVMFGALFTATILLWARRDILPRLLPVWIALYVWLLGVHLGVLPRWLLVN